MSVTLTRGETLKYTAAFAAYNVGGLFMGLYRAGVAVKNLTTHYSQSGQYQFVRESLVERYYVPVEPNKPQGAKNLSPSYKNQPEHNKTAIKQYGWRFPEEQKSFWWGQLLRAITEIVLPIIGSLIWTAIDINNSGKECEAANFQISGKYHVNEAPVPERELRKLNVAGLNTLKVAKQWETDVQKVFSKT